MAKWKHVLNTNQRIQFHSFEHAAQAAMDCGYPAFTWNGWVYLAEFAKTPDDTANRICRVDEVE
jgi:hypothetical protein